MSTDVRIQPNLVHNQSGCTLLSPAAKKNLILAAKIMAVVLTSAAFIAAGYFTCGASVVLAGLAKWAVCGCSIGLIYSGFNTFTIGYKARMYEKTETSLRDTLYFISKVALQSLLITALWIPGGMSPFYFRPLTVIALGSLTLWMGVNNLTPGINTIMPDAIIDMIDGFC